MGKEIKRSESPEFFAKGGDTKMFGKGHADKAVSDYSGKQSQGSADGAAPQESDAEGYASGFKFAEGGTDKMFGKGHAGKATPGVSGKQSQEG